MKTCHFITAASLIFCISTLSAQEPIPVGAGSYASYTPLSESRTTEHDGCQAYQTDHRKLYIEDSLKTRPVPTNDWWTHALVSQWTGNLWAYPAMVRAENGTIDINYPDYWEPTGCEMKWDKTLSISAADFRPQEAILSDWSDFHISFVMKDGNASVKTTLMMGSPLVWLEFDGTKPSFTNSLPDRFATYEYTVGSTTYLTIGLLTEDLKADDLRPYAFRIPTDTRIDYKYEPAKSLLSTTFHITTFNVDGSKSRNTIAGFIPHHYRNTLTEFSFLKAEYQTPRGTLRLATGNDFTIRYKVNTMLPYFPAPDTNLQGYDPERMRSMIADYAQKGSFGADTYWGGKGLTQMAHYMTFAYQIGDNELFEKTKSRLKDALVNWFTYTPGEKDFYFARYQRFGALVGFDSSYDSDTFNDHHFHYGYFVYSAALLCMFDDDFRNGYGQMAREVALDYACWLRDSDRYPLFRTFNPWLGHSFAGGMGGEGGNGQESSSEAMQSWGAIWMLGAALGDKDMLHAGIFGYTLESRGTAEYWFDRSRQNIQYDKYQHPYCCNLTSQGVGWWTWFSGDPVWMHSIQWLPVSPLLTNYLAEDTAFARWDYTQMYTNKQVGNYEAQNGGLGDESGLGNVCLSYLSFFDPDSAARVFDRAWNENKALAKNADTGGITYWLTHSHRTLGNRQYDITADYPMAEAYSKDGQITYAVYNCNNADLQVTFTLTDGTSKQFNAPAHKLTLFTDQPRLTSIQLEGPRLAPANSSFDVKLHFYDQYGAAYRPDSTFRHKAPNTNYSIDFIYAAYQDLKDTLPYYVRDIPRLVEGRIVPDIKYIQYGEQVTFSLDATDQYGWQYESDWKESFTATEIGQHTVSCSIDGQVISHSFTVLPPYPNIALGKPATASSEENGGTLAVNATDGDLTTRWGSAHSDAESITVDLQDLCYIHNIIIRWEAAYASEYQIDISADRKTWTSFYQTCTGGVVNTDINADARYIRLTGIKRATQYGISIYELEAYGIPSKSYSNIFGVLITSDKKVINAGEHVNFTAAVYDINGERLRYAPALAITTNNASIDGNTIYCPTAGEVTLRATAEDKTAEYTWIVQETEQTVSVSISPREITLPIGTSQVFSVQALNQFGIASQTDFISFRAEQLGDNIVVGTIGEMSDTATVHVVNFNEVNLALNKPVTTSGNENNGTVGNNAVDGDFNTRWSSRFQDNEWIEADLQNIYYINQFRLFWEASYATSFSIELSTDGKTYTEVYSTTESRGGEQEIKINDTLGRYVRLNCLTRNSGYGSSLWEFEVYGSGMMETAIDDISAIGIDFSQPVSAYNMLGQCVMNGTANLQQLKQLLPSGLYILRQQDKSLKIKL